MLALKLSLKNKLFLVIIFVLVLNIILSAVLGNTLLDKMYTNDKIKSLKSGVDNIKSKYLSDNMDSTVDEIINYERQNMIICIFSLNTKTGMGEIEYYSRQKYFSSNPFDDEMLKLINNLYMEDAFDELKSNNYYISYGASAIHSNDITVLSKVEDTKYILLQTPVKFIMDMSYSAVKYSMYISIFSLFIVAVIIYLVADRTTKPIRQLQVVADKISNLNFSQRCSILSNDEIGLLAASINNMADKLQEYVEKLKDDFVKLERSDKMTKQLIANVSHDFKTPLTLIMSYSEALIDMEDIDEETKRKYLEIVINEGKKMSEFVQELLKLSQLESGMIKLEETNFSINEIIEDTIYKNSIIAKEKNISVEKHISDNCIVYGDYFGIEQVFQNLYENAIKYCNPGGKVVVSTAVENSKCRVSVLNDGKKIPEEDIDSIFISFYRADKSRKNTGSYGLGLAIVKAIIDMHNERYGVQNAENGVEFWFELKNVDIDSEV